MDGSNQFSWATQSMMAPAKAVEATVKSLRLPNANPKNIVAQAT